MILLHITNGVEVIRYVTHHLYSNINQVQLLIDDMLYSRRVEKKLIRGACHAVSIALSILPVILSRFYMML